jgi:Mycothiol maleylpyruvate isomerase N-terminal domain
MLAPAYGRVTEAVSGLGTADLMRPTRCAGWSVVDLLFHVLCDAQRALVTFASPADGPADVDYVTYWASFKPGGEDSFRHAWWVRRSASAFTEPAGVVRLWTDTAPAAVRAAEAAHRDGFVRTQGHVLAVPDFIATLAVEAAVHYLDLVVDLPEAPPPADEALELTASTLDGLLGAPRPQRWDLPAYILKATGRVGLDERDRQDLGPLVDRFPLLG